MPKKKKRNNRKRSLVFTESPLNTSKICSSSSPVFGALHPITADAVPVDEELDLRWVSPQFDPNCEKSALRRKRKGTRSREACSNVGVSGYSRPALKNDTSQRSGCSPHRSKQVAKALPRRFTCLKFVGDKETPQERLPDTTINSKARTRETSIDSSGPCTRSRSYSLQNGKSRGATAKQYGGKPMDLSVNESLNPAEFEVTQNALVEGHDKQAVPQLAKNLSPTAKKCQRINVPEENFESSIYTNGLRRSSRTRNQYDRGEASYSPKFMRKSRTSSEFPGQLTKLSSGKDRHLRTYSNETPTSPPLRCSEKENDIAGDFAKRLLFGVETRPHQGRVLACDTPEAEYGLKVSIRRRKDLLPMSARNKLLCQ